jgi:phage terminase large subunit GpA-like protein
LLPAPTRETRASRKGKRRLDIELYVPNVTRFKDMVDRRLRRADPGPGYIGFPRDMTRDHLAELTAEEKDADGVWQRKEHRANESFDLLVYSEVVLWRLYGSDPTLSGVPAWARPEDQAVAARGREQAAAAPRDSSFTRRGL